jgi:heme/copper-type cytochrome/quinol oxidase subunit 2
VLSIYNTTDIHHGFAIAGLGVEAIVPPGVEYEIALPKLEGGAVMRIHCHMHPAHRSATLVVLPGR